MKKPCELHFSEIWNDFMTLRNKDTCLYFPCKTLCVSLEQFDRYIALISLLSHLPEEFSSFWENKHWQLASHLYQSDFRFFYFFVWLFLCISLEPNISACPCGVLVLQAHPHLHPLCAPYWALSICRLGVPAKSTIKLEEHTSSPYQIAKGAGVLLSRLYWLNAGERSFLLMGKLYDFCTISPKSLASWPLFYMESTVRWNILRDGGAEVHAP